MKFVIIGSGIAGLTAAETFSKNSHNAEITIISQDQHFPYYRINLMRYAVNELDKEKLYIHDEKWYKSKNINLILGRRATYINPVKKTVVLDNEEEIEYDKLIIATGSNALIPPINGINTNGIHALSSLNDADSIKQDISSEKICLCLGGGVLGLEAAVALSNKIKNVYVVESAPFLMPKQLNREAGSLLKKHIRSFGVNVITAETVSQIISQNGQVSSIVFKSGRQIKSDLVMLATGARPNIELAQKSGIKTNIGIIINNYMRTSEDDIFAAGDSTEINNAVAGTWMSALQQGKIAAMNALGTKTEFKIPSKTFTLKVTGITLTSIGKLSQPTGNFIVYEKIKDGSYAHFTISDSKIINAILIEYPQVLATNIKKAIDNEIKIDNLTKNISVDEIIEQIKGVQKS